LRRKDDFITHLAIILHRADRSDDYSNATDGILSLSTAIVYKSAAELGGDESVLTAEQIERMIASEDEKAQSTAGLALHTQRLHDGIELSRTEGPEAAYWYSRGVIQGVGTGFAMTDVATKLTGIVQRAGKAHTGSVTGGAKSGEARRAWWDVARQRFDQLLAEDPDVRKMTPMEIATLVQKSRIPGSSDGVLQAKIKKWLKE